MAPTPAVIEAASRVIAARNAKNAQPEARKSVIDSWLLRATRSPVSMVAATPTPHPQSSTIDRPRNARVRSR